ncbi:MAG: translation initiation factor IF-2 N-terminal domain-containing protein, partial [Sphaerochaetaceae bacterium]
MAEDDKKPKTTLIKNRSRNLEENTSEETSVRTSEKKKVVVVKKRVVKVKPQPKVVEKPVEVEEVKVSVPAPPKVEKEEKKREPRIESTIGSPIVRAPKNLPPVPGQGQSAEDHAIWRRNNQARAATKEQQRPTKPARGQVGGGQRRAPAQQQQRPPYSSRGPRPTSGAPAAPTEAMPQKTSKKVYRKRKEFKRPEKTVEREFQIKRKDSHKANPVPKRIDIMEVITVADLAKKMNLKASEIIGKLLQMGMMVTINQQIDSDVATLIAGEYDCEVNIVSLYDETLIATEKDREGELAPRAPIVTIMGHVDHGKTKLLDAIRSTDVVADEFGGITQHIGAYKVSLPGKGEIVFLDTPGHAAFTLMRARGAQVTDIVVLVVAANDGVKPQTLEAIDHARAAKVPIIVAINKIDLPEANLDRVKQQLSDHGLMPEQWGGDTLFCEISALKKIGIEELLDTILLQAEMLELSANPEVRAEGKVL